jgi:hypothetical protein
MASRRGQGIWTEGPNVPFTTYKMPEVNKPAVVPPPNVNSGATRNYGSTPDNLNTVSSRYRPYRPPIRQALAYLSEEVEYLDPNTGLLYHGRPPSGSRGTSGQPPATSGPSSRLGQRSNPLPFPSGSPAGSAGAPAPPTPGGATQPTWTSMPPVSGTQSMPAPPKKTTKTSPFGLPPLKGSEQEDPFIAQIRGAEPKPPTQWAGPEATSDVLDLTKPYSPSKAREVTEDAILGFLKQGAKQVGRRQGSKRAKST